MRPAAATLAIVAALAYAGVAAGAPPRVETLVVGKGDKVVRGPRIVATPQRAVVARSKDSGRARSCTVPAATPLAALLALHAPGVRVVDYASCTARARDAAGLYVDRVGGYVARGSDGWVYKVGRLVYSTGAADVARTLKSGQRLLWFYCRMQTSGGCQRTLDLTSAAPPAGPFRAGAPVSLVVRGYDDRGKGVPIGGASVTIAGVTATSQADGTVSITPPFAGRFTATATAPGLVRSFPLVVTVA
jgi:hypothetical protein